MALGTSNLTTQTSQCTAFSQLPCHIISSFFETLCQHALFLLPLQN